MDLTLLLNNFIHVLPSLVTYYAKVREGKEILKIFWSVKCNCVVCDVTHVTVWCEDPTGQSYVAVTNIPTSWNHSKNNSQCFVTILVWLEIFPKRSTAAGSSEAVVE